MSVPTLVEYRRLLQAKQISPKEILLSLQQEIETTDANLKGYLSTDLDLALADAEKADLSKPLGGIPIAIKDLINVRGHPCSCASRLLHGAYTAPYDASAIGRLREAGAIPFGRTNMDEFAMGSSTENSAIQISKNPVDPTRVPGGSSGGSAVVVASGSAVAALGSDTGGSIRQPASFCGIVGLKPTYGRVSRYGMTAFASSLDQIGPMARTVADTALLYQGIAGYDPHDTTSLNQPVPDCLTELESGIAGWTVGVPKEFFAQGLSDSVRKPVEAALETWKNLGAKLKEISLPMTDYAVATYYILATAEASANLARFDGVRYGNRPESQDLADVYELTRSQGFGPEVKRRILLGCYVLSSGYYDAYYLRAQKVRTLIRDDFRRAFQDVDLIVGPTTPETAWKLGARTKDPLSAYLADIYTVSANLAGLPALSTPCGTDENSLPVGLQIIGPHGQEARILRAARAFEREG